MPEWYFLPFYAILRAFSADVYLVMQFVHFITFGIVDAKFFGVLAMFGAILAMALAPVAGHLVGAFGPLSPDVQVVVLPAGDRLCRSDVGGRDADRRDLSLHLADRRDLLVRLLPHHPAAAGCDRKAAAAAGHDRRGLHHPLRRQIPSGR